MRFYGRENELDLIAGIQQRVESEARSRMVIVSGRRRIGKTSLLLKAADHDTAPTLYCFTYNYAREADLAEMWMQEVVKKLSLRYAPTFTKIIDVIEFIFEQSRSQRINLIIDECQELNNVNPSFWSLLQRLWDLNKNGTRLGLFLSGSIASAMRNIFENYSEPLYGRADTFLRVEPFTPSILKQILQDYSPDYENDDLLALYCLTGGVAKYVETIIDAQAFTRQKMFDLYFSRNSIFLNEGNIMLANEFKSDYGVYFSILKNIASGITKRSELQDRVDVQINGHLAKLENIFNLITRYVPMYQKPGSRRTSFRMTDRFLMFWFAFIQNSQQLIAANNYEQLKADAIQRYETYSGRVLEQYFFEKLRETGQYTALGQWWDRSGQNEIDLIAVDDAAKKAVFYEIKRNPEKISLSALESKIDVCLKSAPELSGYQIERKGLSLDDM